MMDDQEPTTPPPKPVKQDSAEVKAILSNPNHTKSLLEEEHKLLTYVLSKLSQSERQTIKCEQKALADMLDD